MGKAQLIINLFDLLYSQKTISKSSKVIYTLTYLWRKHSYILKTMTSTRLPPETPPQDSFQAILR